MMGTRFAACMIVLLFYLYHLTPYNGPRNDLKAGECMRDYTFIWTEKMNQYMVDNEEFRKRYMIYAGFLMDFLQIVGISNFFLRFQTFRGIFSFILFMPTRAFIQNSFLMARPKGFAWFDPGMPALTIPYHDTNDFFWSGHVGTCFMYTLEFFLNGPRCMGYAGIFIGVNQWILLWFVRTHYIIDLVTGLLIAHWAAINAEWLSYFIDVKLLGWARQGRNQHAHVACEKCGWSNEKFSLMISEEEKTFLEKTYRIRKQNQHKST